MILIKKKLLNYWYLNLEEAKYLDINDQLLTPIFSISQEEFQKGRIKDLNFLDRKIVDDEQKIFLCPMAYKKKRKHTKVEESPDIYFMLLIMPVSITKDGRFQIVDRPFIPRKYLYPSKEDLIISSTEKVDKYWEANPFPESPTWERALEIMNHFMDNVSSRFFLGPLIQYKKSDEIPVVDYSENSVTADLHVRKFYENHLTRQDSGKKYAEMCKKSLLAKRVLSDENEENKTLPYPEQKALVHLGQMKSNYQLTESQRNALHHTLTLEEGELLSIEGPPGTGKTTLLQSVVAAMIVQSALKETKTAPIILASGSTNSSIQNILESFRNKDHFSRGDFPKDYLFERIEQLWERWIPGVNSLGAYCISPSRQKQHQRDQLILINNNKSKSDANMSTNWIQISKLQLNDIEAYEKEFLRQCSLYLNTKVPNVRDARKALHTRLRQCTHIITGSLDTLVDYRLISGQVNEWLEKKKKEKFIDVISETKQMLDQSKKEEQTAKEWINDWFTYQSGRNPLTPWLLKIPFIQKTVQKQLFKANKNFVSQILKEDTFQTYTDQEIERQLELLKKEREIQYLKLETEYQAQQDLNQKWELRKKQLNDWSYPEIPAQLEQAQEKLDRYYRVLAFYLSIHYWEARWIEQAKIRVEKQQGEFDNLKSFYQEVAMLTPCLISTMYMAPRYFNERYQYLYGFAELLLIDEASQALPELMFPVFSLAKKALVVGDTQQLPPIPRINQSQDDSNLLKSGLDKLKTNADNLAIRSVNGSVMKMANRLTRYVDADQKPFMMVEHFRCHPSIAKYFNEVFYTKKLKVESKETSTFHLPQLGFAHIDGQEERSGTSLVNHIEAATIVLWVQQFFEQWNIHNENKQKESIAILTPFAQQASVIRKYLMELKIKSLKVGTVHSLQGEEYKIVLFSPVYTEQSQEQHFYDRQKYILNVATSRAKESFLVFGHRNCFGLRKKEPSYQLKNYCMDVTEALMLPEEEEVNQFMDRMKKEFQRELSYQELSVTKNYIVNSHIENSQIGNNQNAILKIQK